MQNRLPLRACLLSLPLLGLTAVYGAQGNNEIKVNGYADIIKFDKPIAYYRFEEATGNKTTNEGTSGATNDGLWMFGGGPDDSSPQAASVEAGPRPPDFKGFATNNLAAKFVGADANTQGIWVDTQGQLLQDLPSFSLEYWVSPANRVSNPSAFGTRVGIVGQNDAIEYGFIDQNNIQIWTPNGGSLNTAYSFPDNTWHHVATIATGRDIRNYYDGVLVGTSGSATTDYGNSTFNVHIGGGGVFDGTGNFFTGDIDEVAIFDKEIPADRIAQHYKAGKEGAFSVPFIGEPTGSDTNFTIQVNDFSPILADTNTIVLSLNGATVKPTLVTKAAGLTTVTYAAPTPFPSQSVQTVGMSINDTTGVTYTNSGSFTAPYYGTLTPALKVTNADTSKPGFVWNFFQNEADTSNSNDRANREVAGVMLNADGTPMQNNADPNASGVAVGPGTPANPGNKAVHFEIPTVINMSRNGTDNVGNWTDALPASAPRPDDVMPGLPGTTGSTDGTAGELIAWVDLPQGWVTMGVNSDDGFGTAAGPAPDVFNQIVLGVDDVGRGASDTTFSFWVQEAGIYRLRTIWENGTGGCNIEWFSVVGTNKILLNDTANGGLKTYRAITGTEATPAKVISVVPAMNVTNASPLLLSANLVDGDTAIDKSTVQLALDGTPVNATVTKTGGLTMATYRPNPAFASATKHTATISYTEGGTKISHDWQFTVLPYTPVQDTVHSYTGLLEGPGGITPDKGGHTGQPGDFALDSTPAGGTWVNIQDPGFLNAVNAAATNDTLSVALWVKKYDIAAGSGFWGRVTRVATGTDLRGFQSHIPWSDDIIYFDTAGCCDANLQRISANINTFPAWKDNGFWTNWHHFVYTKKADQKNIYIDGQLFLNGSSSDPLPPAFDAWSLLTDGIPGGDFMHGLIDDFAVFSTEVSAADAAKLAAGASPKDLTGETLLALWDFNAPPNTGGVRITGATVSAGNITITWTGGGTLQTATAVNGPWTDVQGKTSPATLPVTGSAGFFRVKQ